MPIIDIKVLRGGLSVEQKKELVEKVGEAALSVEGEKMRPYLMVGITEIDTPAVMAGKTLVPREPR